MIGHALHAGPRPDAHVDVTLFFNASTFHATQTGLSTKEQNRLVWGPDLLGSGCFLASGVLAYSATTGGRRMAGINWPAACCS